MNVTFAQKFAKTKLTTTILLCSTLAMTQVLIGCTNKDDKKTNKKTDTASQTDGKNTPLDCASPSAMTGIQQYITKQIAQQANSTVQQLGQQAHINVQNVSMDSILAQLMVNVQNVKAVSGQADQCQGKVSVTIPASDIANANQMATSLNQPTLAQRLSSKGLTLENNTIIADNATFKLPSNGGSYQVNSPSADTIISEVSNVMANSQLKQMMIQNAPTANSNAIATSSTTTTTTTNTSTVSNGAVATGAVVAGAGAVATHHLKKHSTTHASATHHEPSKRIATKHTERDSDDEPYEKVAKKSTTTKAPDTKTSVHKTTSETANTKTVITKTTTEKTNTPAKVTTTHTTEKTVTKPQAVPNDTTKLTIEQRNEKY